MNKQELRQLIREEISKIMDEADETQPKTKFKKGDEFPYMGSRYTVLSDDGYVVKAKRNKDGYQIMLNYAQLNER
jgi:hypothetical protein